jgi:restriction system protein
MTPRQYEEGVASHFRQQGFEARLTSYSNDFGVDVFATRGHERIAIQAKMYGGSSRPINHEMVLQLQGAKDYFECTQAMIVTNGRMTASASEVAGKLGIKVLVLSIEQLHTDQSVDITSPRPSAFDRIWIQYIMPLAGRILPRPDGKTNTILKVDWSGVERLTSNGNKNKLPIEIFRKAVEQLLRDEAITRTQINDDYAKRGSSGVILILSQVPEFEHTTHPKGLRLRPSP